MTSSATPRLGRMLVERGLITEQQLLHALALHRIDRRPLGEILLERGLVSEAELARTLSTPPPPEVPAEIRNREPVDEAKLDEREAALAAREAAFAARLRELVERERALDERKETFRAEMEAGRRFAQHERGLLDERASADAA